MFKVADVIQVLESLAPTAYQESYDNSGLQTGNYSDQLTGILVTLDCTPEVINEAIERGCNLVVAHHPVIFKGLKQLTGRNYVEQTILKAIKNDISIYACHTNLDNMLQGVNAKICEKIGLRNLKILAPKTQVLQKLVTFIPVPDTDEVLEAMHQAGAGNIGDYKNCSFQVSGKGRFIPTGNADPTIGEVGKPEEVAENRVEVIFPSHLSNKIITALQKAHPYEEVAYYLSKLENEDQEIGAGMIGELENPMEEQEFLKHLKAKMNLQVVKHTPLLNKPIKRVAVCGGSGSFLLKNAIRRNADIYITGDVKYHEYFDAEKKLIFADIGHYESEVFTKEIFYDVLLKNFPNFAVYLSNVNTNPVRYT